MNQLPSVNNTAKGKFITISQHTEITLKLGKENSNYINKGWKTAQLEWTEESILNAVRNSGIMPGILKNDHKLNDNVIGFQSVMIDYDSGNPSFNYMLDKVKQMNCAAFLFTSVNHQKIKTGPNGEKKEPCDRFRLFIPFKEIITPKQFKRLSSLIKEEFPGVDLSFDTTNRYFAPSPASLYYFQDGEFMDAGLITADDENSRTYHTKATHFSKNDFVTLHDGTEAEISSITEHTKIICRYCDPKDRNNEGHNAFIDLNEEGIYYQFCSSEKKTRWQNPEEVDFTRMNMFFSVDTGTPISVDVKSDSMFHIFKTEKDWNNYCFHNKLDTKIQQFLPRLSATFNPQLKYGPDEESGLFNTYVEPAIIKEAGKNREDGVTLDWLKLKCPTISKVLWNLFGDDTTVDHFLNWFSYIAASKQKPFTTFLIVSVPGAGKNVLFEKVLSKLIGENQSDIVFSDKLTNRFNSRDAHLILKAIDELYAPNNLKMNEYRKQFIKSDIGSTYKMVEPKGVDSFKVPNFMSYILFSNVEGLAFAIDHEDRRFNVIQNREGKQLAKEPWWMGRAQFEKQIEEELLNFAIYTVSREVDSEKANTAITSVAKTNMQTATEEDSQTFIRLLKERDWNGFDFDEISFLPLDMVNQCEEVNGIPAKYLSIIMHELLGSDRLSMKKRLKAQGMYSAIAKNSEGKSIRVYRAR